MRLESRDFVFEHSETKESFLFCTKTGEIFTLNREGALLMKKLLSEKCSVSTLVMILVKECNASESEAREDVIEFLERLQDYGFEMVEQ